MDNFVVLLKNCSLNNLSGPFCLDVNNWVQNLLQKTFRRFGQPLQNDFDSISTIWRKI